MTITMPTREPIKVLADILVHEMDLQSGQIMLGLENWVIPKTEGLYVALFYGPETVVGQNNEFDSDSDTEVQSVAMMHEIDLEVLSFNSEARTRKEEVLQALNSIFAQQELGAEFMKINEIPNSFIAVPTLEETKMLNRFRIEFHMNALHQKTKVADFYNDFKQPAVTTNQ